MVWKGEKLVALDLTGSFFYVILVSLGLSVAGFLFGVVKSYAGYRGHQLTGTLSFRGPIIAFFLVIILGFFLPSSSSSFPLTVYVHGPGGPPDIVLSNSGEVFMDLGGDRRHVPIGDQGQAYFPAIPASFRAKEVLLWVSSERFESIQSDKKVKLDGRSIYIPVRTKAGRLYGRVESDGSNCLFAAQVHAGGVAAPVDPASGNFELLIPGDRLRDGLVLEAVAPGCASAKYNVVPNSNAIVVTLRQERAARFATK